MTHISYLATPYSHPDREIESYRYRVVTWTAHWLIAGGRWVYSPITHNVPFSEWGIGGAFAHWGPFDCSMLSRCDALIVLTLPGWEESIGVSAEIAHAKELDLPIEHLEPPYDELEKASIICEQDAAPCSKRT